MSQKDIYDILKAVEDGRLTAGDAALRLKLKPFEDLGYAKIDYHRELRQGVAEVVYGEGKTPDQLLGIAENMLENGRRAILITRVSPETARALTEKLPAAYHPEARAVTLGDLPEPDGRGDVVVATGGTTDIPVAEEAALTAEFLGNRVTRLYDVGVSGLHRLLANLETIMRAQAVVAVAGMEGALPSVIGGLCDCPVIAVPTSVGYGASLGGFAALLSMLNSCASGTSVVNIDNGFGGGYLASMINHIGVKG